MFFQHLSDIAAKSADSVVKVRDFSGLTDLNSSGIASQRDFYFKIMLACESSSFIEEWIA